MSIQKLQTIAIECRNIAEQILQERGMSKTYRARLETDKVGRPRIVIEQYYKVSNCPTDWHFVSDFIFLPSEKIEYWSCGSTSWTYDLSIEQFEKLMNNVGNYHIV